MVLVVMAVGFGIMLFGLALMTDHRGITRRIVDTHFNLAYAEPSLLRVLGRLGFDQPGMDFFRNRPKMLLFMRIWGGLAALMGLMFVAIGIMTLVRP